MNRNGHLFTQRCVFCHCTLHDSPSGQFNCGHSFHTRCITERLFNSYFDEFYDPMMCPVADCFSHDLNTMFGGGEVMSVGTMRLVCDHVMRTDLFIRRYEAVVQCKKWEFRCSKCPLAESIICYDDWDKEIIEMAEYSHHGRY